MKRSLAFIFSGIVALAATGVQAQDHHDDSHSNQNDSHSNQGGPGHSSPSHGHASASHGSFKENGRSHQYSRGQKLPSQYRGSSHYVSNYNQYHLSAPPHGQRWVRDDSGNFILVAVATGVIAQILSGN